MKAVTYRVSVIILVLSAFLFYYSSSVDAQQPKKMPTIGYLSVLSPSSDSARIGALRQSLAELGYVEGHTIAIQPRYTEGKLNQLPKLAGELVELDVDVMLPADLQPFELQKMPPS